MGCSNCACKLFLHDALQYQLYKHLLQFIIPRDYSYRQFLLDIHPEEIQRFGVHDQPMLSQKLAYSSQKHGSYPGTHVQREAGGEVVLQSHVA